jgi:hypothetical protein
VSRGARIHRRHATVRCRSSDDAHLRLDGPRSRGCRLRSDSQNCELSILTEVAVE